MSFCFILMQEVQFDLIDLIYNNHFFLPPLYGVELGLPGVLDLLWVLPGFDEIGGGAPEDLKKLSRRTYVLPFVAENLSIFLRPLSTFSALNPFLLTKNSFKSSSTGLFHFNSSYTFSIYPG